MPTIHSRRRKGREEEAEDQRDEVEKVEGIMADSREKALQDYRKKLLEHKEVDGRLKERTVIFCRFQRCERNVWFPVHSKRRCSCLANFALSCR